MKAITVVSVFLIAAVPGFCQAPHRALSSLFNSSLAFAVPLPDSTPISTSVVTTSNNAATIAPNAWIEVHGSNLAPGVPAAGDTWSNSDFSKGLPQSLDGVSATVNGKSAAVYFVSPGQVNVLAPIDSATGPVQVQVKTQYGTSTPLNVNEQTMSPAFLIIDQPNHHVAAVHYPSGNLLGPPSLSVPGYTFTYAYPGEIVELYATGFGQTAPPITDQKSGVGSLPTPWPQITIGGLPADVSFAGITAPGLYQFNITIPLNAPTNAPNGADLALIATYNGATTQAQGTVITVGPKPQQ